MNIVLQTKQYNSMDIEIKILKFFVLSMGEAL
ncbi:hypothetical protein QG37_03444 [Candidozyma auris]|uniref:Uncharacterized protein n=1 Tax=Candidozyma auris TaxID=498019 RepID=A0A0L0P089_CANAR|nr:hypothetical protein QG37_03444 [[Candida] auris]